MKKIWIVLIIIVTALSQSCSPVYFPTNSNVPLFTEKGELQLSGYHGSNGLTAQGAVTFIDHLAIIGNFGYTVHEDEDSHKNKKQKVGELGVGYYNTFSRAGKFEIYGGYGRGNSMAYDFFDLEENDTRTDAKFEKWFIQGNLGLGNRIVEGAISYRMTYVNFYEVKGMHHQTGVLHYDPMEELMLEPSFTIKVGSENLKFVSQAGLTFPYDDYAKFDYFPFYISMGIMGKIPLW